MPIVSFMFFPSSLDILEASSPKSRVQTLYNQNPISCLDLVIQSNNSLHVIIDCFLCTMLIVSFMSFPYSSDILEASSPKSRIQTLYNQNPISCLDLVNQSNNLLHVIIDCFLFLHLNQFKLMYASL